MIEYPWNHFFTISSSFLSWIIIITKAVKNYWENRKKRILHSENRDERASPVFFSGKQMMTMFCYGFHFLYWGAENIIFLNVKNFQ